MLDPIINLFSKLFELIGRGIGYVIAGVLWPFVTFRNWLRGKGWFVKIPVFIILVLIFISYVAMVQVASDLIDKNVNQGTWLPSNPVYKAGLFFAIDWKETPFFDNRAAFQLGKST